MRTESLLQVASNDRFIGLQRAAGRLRMALSASAEPWAAPTLLANKRLESAPPPFASAQKWWYLALQRGTCEVRMTNHLRPDVHLEARRPRWLMHAGLNNLQAVVLGFLGFAWLSVILILVVAPDTYDQALRLTPGNSRRAELVFIVALSAFILLVAMGVLRRWRWIFWLLLVAFLAGVLRVPASIVELAGWLPATGPGWYVVFQALIGAVQLAIGVLMLIEYRRYGIWGRHD